MTSYIVADTSLDIIHGSGAQFVETAGSSKPQIHNGDTERPVRRNSGSAMESAYVKTCVGRCSQSHSEFDYDECVVAIHVLRTAQVKFKVLEGTEPTLSMPMLVANGNRVVFSGEDAMLITAKGETEPLMNAGDDWYLKVLINNRNEFLRIDVWTPCHVCPQSWVRNLSPEMKQRERFVVRDIAQQETRKGMQVPEQKMNQQVHEQTERLRSLESLITENQKGTENRMDQTEEAVRAPFSTHVEAEQPFWLKPFSLEISVFVDTG